ncbi:MAG TPA: hypothetical protein VF552_03470 [Allosphingosinicella sp.]|jgi:hypothetical protein
MSNHRTSGLRLLAAAAASLCLAAPAAAAERVAGSQVSFTDRQGRHAIFDVLFPESPPLVPAALSPQTIAAEFDRLCLRTGFDQAALAAAAPQSALGLVSLPLRSLGDRRTPPFDIPGWQGPAATARIWNGDERTFRRMPFVIVTAGVIITGPGPRMAPQCNLDVASTAAADFPGLVGALSAAIGAEPASSQIGRRRGEATWRWTSPAGDQVTVGIRADDLNRPSQRIHLGAVKSTGQTEE